MKFCLNSLFVLLLILNAQFTYVYSQLMYPCDSISTHLLTGAKAVIRSGERKITIMNEKQSRMETKMVVTLLNDKAEELLMVGIPYDDLRRISSIRAYAYDESGKLIWILRNYRISDTRDFSGPEKLSDTRKKVFKIPSHNYPFTIEYSYVMTMKDLFLSPAVYLQPDPEISVEESGLQFIIPKGIGFNYKALNLNSPKDSLWINNRLYLTWKEEHLPAGRQRKYAPPVGRKLPVVYATPVDFDLYGYKGSFRSWKDYGTWMGQLIAGRDSLDQAYAEQAQSLVQNISERREKVKALYKYLQQNTHYFFIGFGIGGNQPMHANEVAKNGYGDCKALTNYMKALLKVVGIESYYTLARSGDNRTIRADVPCNQFDHVILCIPDNSDTIWLECTNPNLPFDYLGSFTCDRQVLAITPEGGKLLRTPSYGSMTSTYTEIVLFDTGDAEIKLKFDQSGLLYEKMFEMSDSKPDERQHWLSNQFGSAAYELNKEEYTFDRDVEIPSATARYELHFHDLAAKSSRMLFISPSFLSNLTYVPDEPGEIELDLTSQQEDSVRIEIPAGYQVEYLPESKQLISRFGSYQSNITSDDSYIYFTRKLSFNKAVYPREAYPEFYDFITNLVIADKDMLILKIKD